MLSSADVASSNSSILLCFRSARAMASLCFCPPDRVVPPSPRMVL